MSAQGENNPVDVTILMPCLNEARTLPQCIAWAKEALATLQVHGLSGEILIADNGSTDGSQQLAETLGCRVAHCAAKGYGAALICGSHAARGTYIVMGDSDASYDFRDAAPMVLKLREGYDLCMGNRFRGRILPGAMPWKNRYIGNPVLSGILNLFYHSGLGDAHCGLRAYTKKAFAAMRLQSTGMEFASEMVVKATLHELKRTEVPVTLHPDGRGRPPHLNPWRDGWRHLKFLLMLSPLWLYVIPSTCLITLGALIFAALLSTPPNEVLHIGRFWIGDHWIILAGGLCTIGHYGLIIGLASFLYSVQHQYCRPLTSRMRRLYDLITVENAGLVGVALGLLGLGVFVHVLWAWGVAGFGPLSKTREVVIGTTLIVVGLQTFFGGFLLSLIGNDGNVQQPGI